jgi:hypothetical protein
LGRPARTRWLNSCIALAGLSRWPGLVFRAHYGEAQGQDHRPRGRRIGRGSRQAVPVAGTWRRVTRLDRHVDHGRGRQKAALLFGNLWTYFFPLANGGQKRSWSARSATRLASSGGQRRTGAVIRGHNPVALAACAPRSPSALAAYRGQRRTKWRRGISGLTIVEAGWYARCNIIRHLARVRARGLMTSD